MLDGKLKAYLIVALAGAAVADGVGAFLERDVHKSLCNTRTRGACTEQILFIDRAGLHGRDDVFVHIFVRQIKHIQLARAGLDGLFLQPFQLIRLADVAGHGNDFAVVVVLFQPRDDDRRIQTAGIGEDDFFDIFLIHSNNLSFEILFGIIHAVRVFVKSKMNILSKNNKKSAYLGTNIKKL